MGYKEKVREDIESWEIWKRAIEDTKSWDIRRRLEKDGNKYYVVHN